MEERTSRNEEVEVSEAWQGTDIDKNGGLQPEDKASKELLAQLWRCLPWGEDGLRPVLPASWNIRGVQDGLESSARSRPAPSRPFMPVRWRGGRKDSCFLRSLPQGRSRKVKRHAERLRTWVLLATEAAPAICT